MQKYSERKWYCEIVSYRMTYWYIIFQRVGGVGGAIRVIGDLGAIRDLRDLGAFRDLRAFAVLRASHLF